MYRIYVLLLPLVIFIFGLYFIYYQYSSLTQTIKSQSEQIDDLKFNIYTLNQQLTKAQRDYDFYKRDLIDTSFPDISENLTSSVTGFISPFIKDGDVAIRSELKYKDQTVTQLSANLADIEVRGGFPISFSEFIYEKEPYFTYIIINQGMANEYAAMPVPVILMNKDYWFSTTNGLKVYRNANDGSNFRVLFTPQDNKPRLVQLGYTLLPEHTAQDEVAAKMKIMDIFNSVEVQ